MEEQWLIEKNEAWIWAQVRKFTRGIAGYGTYKCSPEDLYQECVLYILQQFRQSNLSAENFRVSPLNLKHVMCRYIMSLLPIHVATGQTASYVKTMQTYGNRTSLQDIEDAQCSQNVFNDLELGVDVEAMTKDLSERDQKAIKYLLAGHSFGDIQKNLSIPKSSIDKMKHRFARRYADFFADDE